MANILIVDDQSYVRQLLSEELANEGYRVASVGDAESIWGYLRDSPPDVVLLDPPRSGLRTQDLESVVRLKPERIIYISCDPPTLARDIRRFISHGFSVDAAHPIDLFPQTYHVETIVLLSHR